MESSISLLGAWQVRPEWRGIEGVSIVGDCSTCRGCSVIVPGALVLVKGIGM